MIHIALHIMLPLLVAVLFFNRQWQRAYWIMLATMVVDIDHLLAVPIYDPGRCSIGFHPLHQFIPIGLYLSAMFFQRTRLIAVGLIIHMLLDSIDCFTTGGVWFTS